MNAMLPPAVVIAAVASALLMARHVVRVRRRGVAPVLSRPRGSAAAGVAYAFGRGMSPRAKESAWRHPWVTATGAVFHVGIAGACAWLALSLTGAAPESGWRTVWAVVLAPGAVAGGLLLLRRARSAVLRAISVPDDFVSNVLTTAFVALAALDAVAPPAGIAVPIAAILLLAYAPFGKIRHCVFFFLARGRFGALFGHRGVLPGPTRGGRP
jgi:hypothetical protein